MSVCLPCIETNFKGSSNSQDSFPAPGATPTSMDGYGGYPGGYPPGTGPGYNERPPSQNNAMSPHSGRHLLSVYLNPTTVNTLEETTLKNHNHSICVRTLIKSHSRITSLEKRVLL